METGSAPVAPLDIVAAHLAAFNDRDAEAVVATLAEDAVFSAGGQLTIGRRALRALFTDAFALPADATLELRRAVVDGAHAACELVERIAIGGAAHELDVAAFYTVRDGLLARVRVYRETPG